MSLSIEFLLNIPAESLNIEFKRLNGDKVVKKIIETIVAMANTEGGNIILGIDDPEKTGQKGINRVYGIEENIDIYDAIGREITKIVQIGKISKLFKKWVDQRLLEKVEIGSVKNTKYKLSNTNELCNN